jgi:hypothetical protein
VFTRQDLIENVRGWPYSHVDANSDFTNGVPKAVVRCICQGKRAVLLGCDLERTDQIMGLLDLLSLHLSQAAVCAGQRLSKGMVTVILGDCRIEGEVPDALRTLAGAMQTGPQVELLLARDDGTLSRLPDTDLDFGDSDALFPDFSDLLMAIPSEPPPLVTRIIDRVDDPGLRAYP